MSVHRLVARRARSRKESRAHPRHSRISEDSRWNLDPVLQSRHEAVLIDRVINRDRKAARRTVETILRWDFRHIILAHGNVVEHDAARAFPEAYTWL